MNININHTSFIKFMETCTKNITEAIDISNYIDADNKKKTAIDYIVYQTFIKSFSYKVKLSDTEKEKILEVLMLHHAKKENYVLALIFKNIKNNIPKYSEVKTRKRIVKKPVN